MKRFFCIILLTVCLILPSCSRSDYVDEANCADLGGQMTDSLDDGQEYLEFDSNHREFYFDDTEEYDDCYLVYSSDTNDINEIGVFHAPNGDEAKELFETCRDYIEDMQENSRSFIASYAPEELPKLDNAEVRRFGNYVIYTILPEDKAEAVFEKVEESLRK